MTTSAACTLPAAAHAAAPGGVAWGDMLAHRHALVRFARRKLMDPALAEDVVHDVFEAVLSGRAVFSGRSALRSWLTAIVKHKIVDLVRSRACTVSLDDGDDDDGHAGVLALECPQPRPDAIAEQRERLAHTLARIDALPASLRDVMRLRVLQDQPADEVCAALAISEDNLFVRLHRARRRLLS